MFLLILFAFDVAITRPFAGEILSKHIGRERLARIYSPTFHHGFLPNRQIEDAEWGAHRYGFYTNSLGMKDKAVREVAAEPADRRLLIIGDSFTEGAGFNFEATFPGLIAERLAPSGVEVLNAGVISYAPSIYDRRVRQLWDEGLRFDRVAVFLDISDIEDEAVFYRVDDSGNVVERDLSGIGVLWHRVEETVRDFLKRSSSLYVVGSYLNRLRKTKVTHRDACVDAMTELGDVHKVPKEAITERLMHRTRATWTFDDAVFSDWGARGLTLGAQHMDRLATFLAERDVGLTLVVYPWPQQVFAKDLDSRQVAFWKVWAEGRGVDFLNLFPAFIGDPEAEGFDPFGIYARYYIPCDEHWNAEGHRLVAERFLAAYPRDAGGR
ncbi:MAG: SGNH/GDSL hydrolase family protein [Leptospirillia bacterium]